MALTTFTTYQETQKAVFCDICLEHITNLYYGNISLQNNALFLHITKSNIPFRRKQCQKSDFQVSM